jgi:Dioxygenase
MKTVEGRWLLVGMAVSRGPQAIEKLGGRTRTRTWDPLVKRQRRDQKNLANALVEVWQTAPNQLDDVQDENQPSGHLRASFRTDTAGIYRFRTIMPVSYPIPNDGPVGRLLAAMGRHPLRPAHVHFMINTPRYRTLVTHLFLDGDKHLESDAAFAVKPSLIIRPRLMDGITMGAAIVAASFVGTPPTPSKPTPSNKYRFGIGYRIGVRAVPSVQLRRMRTIEARAGDKSKRRNRYQTYSNNRTDWRRKETRGGFTIPHSFRRNLLQNWPFKKSAQFAIRIDYCEAKRCFSFYPQIGALRNTRLFHFLPADYRVFRNIKAFGKIDSRKKANMVRKG